MGRGISVQARSELLWRIFGYDNRRGVAAQRRQNGFSRSAVTVRIFRPPCRNMEGRSWTVEFF